MLGDKATVVFRRQNGNTFSRSLCGLVYAAGRRGTLDYLDVDLRCEVLGRHNFGIPEVSGKTLRTKAMDDLEVAPGVYFIGSSTRDSLVRFAYGSCVYTTGRLVGGEGDIGSIHSSLHRQPNDMPLRLQL